MLTAEQIALRRTRIGSSEVGALLGIDPYKSKHDVFLEKTLPVEDVKQDHRSWGLDLEPAILAHHARKRGYELLTPPGSLVHPSLPLVCTPDALARAGGVTIDLQAKNDQNHGQLQWGEAGTDDAPLLYVAQVTVELGVLRAAKHDVSHGELVVSIGGAPPVAYRIDFDAELFSSLADLAEQFKRDHLDTGKPPEGTVFEQAEYIKRRWSKDTGPMLEPTPELVAKVQTVTWLRAQEKTLKAEMLAAENDLKAAIGDAAGIAGLCTYKTQKRAAHTVKESTSRVLRLVKQHTTEEA